MSKPSVFIGSSSEGVEVAMKLQTSLTSYAEATVWHQGVFGLGVGTLETLVDAAPKFDFAVLVLTPDDLIDSRGVQSNAPRDNVLFELGLFMGVLGRTRTFILTTDSRDLKLPSDLAGVATARYSKERNDGNLSAALGPAATQISDQIKALGHRNPEVFSLKLKNSAVHIKKGDILDYVDKNNALLLSANVYLDTTSEETIVDERSTLGKRLAMFTHRDQSVKFDADLDKEIGKSGLTVASNQQTLEKPGRQDPYSPGSLVHVETEQGPIAMLSLTHVEKFGGRFVATLTEEVLASALNAMWKNIEAAPIRGDLYIPIVGSGFGGITRSTALAHLLLSYRAAETRSQSRLCPTLNIIVYHEDWEDGRWVRHLFEGIMT